MKKLISILLLTVSLTGVCISVFAEEEIIGLEKNLDELLMRNYFTQEELAKMEDEYMKYYSELALNTIIPGRQELDKMETKSIEEEYELIMEQAKIDFDGGLRVSHFLNYSYGDQYASIGNFSYLFDKKEYWVVPQISTGNGHSRTSYKINGDKIEYKDLKNYLEFENSQLYKQYKVLALVEEKSSIEKLLLTKGETEVKEIKYCSIFSRTGLYIKCQEKEYFLKTYDPYWEIYKYNDDTYYEFMTVYEMTQEYEQYRYSRSKSYVTPVKATFETEALSLQECGLLYGNENGLDLLKPLTRIEAATMLLRAMGKNTSSDNTLQTFADVSPSHWGYAAAEKAYSLGLIKGVGDDLFAPDDIVTGAQFATMVLRAGNYTEFNWEDALNILVDEEIISSKNADTMDFFTRGDMAKIIYESIEKGLF